MGDDAEKLEHPLSDAFARAVATACAYHRWQPRKGTQIPYAAHLFAVTAIVLEHGGSEDEAIAALLHDAIEDQGVAEAEIARQFGDGVARIVKACSDAEVRPKLPWRARKEAYLAHLQDASASALLVSAADKLHNARAIVADLRELGPDLWKRFNVGVDDQLWYYRSLVDEFRRAAHAARVRRIVDELDRVVREMGSLAGATAGADGA